jgi:hypothetical protein
MGRLRFFVVFASMVCMHFGCFAQHWLTIKTDSRSSIDFPIKPDSTQEDNKTTFVAKDSNCVFTLIMTAVKDSDPNSDYMNLAYSSLSDNLNKLSGFKLVEGKDFTLNKLPGKYFDYKSVIGSGNLLRSKERAFYYDGRLYAFTCTSIDTGSLFMASSLHFLESFKINANIEVKPPDEERQGDMYLKFRFGHLVFSGIFALIAFGLYYIYKKRDSSA